MSTITELLTYESEKYLEKAYEVIFRGVKFVDLDFFSRQSYVQVCSVCYDYNIDVNFKQKDVKKIFINEFIKGLCEYIVKNRHTRLVFCYSKNECDVNNEIKTINDYIIKRISKLLPITILYNEVIFSAFVDNINNNDIDTVSDACSVITSLEGFRNEKYNFSKLKNFLKKNELSFLHKEYFNLHQVKLALMT